MKRIILLASCILSFGLYALPPVKKDVVEPEPKLTAEWLKEHNKKYDDNKKRKHESVLDRDETESLPESEFPGEWVEAEKD